MELSLLAAAAEVPDRPALIAGGRSYTFAELAERVRAVLPGLQGTSRAALVGDSDLPTLVALYGLIELGRPVLLLHPRSTSRERGRLLEACAPVALIDPLSLPGGSEGDPPPVGDESCLAIVPTSGSTGPAKGVVLSRRAFVAAAAASAHNLGWQDGDRWLLSLSAAHVGGLSIVTRCLVARRTVVAHRLESFAADEVIGAVERHRVTLLSLVPTTLRRLLEREPRWTPPPYLRAILLGGAAAPPALVEESARRGWPVQKTYGLTEACSQVATQTYGTPPVPRQGCPLLPGMEARIRDGAIELRGPQLLSGYLPETPVLTEDGWFRTEDLGRIDEDGRLQVLGRRDEVVTSGGENVALPEVEQVLEEHPAIAAAVAFGVPDEEWGEVVGAVLVASGDAPPDGDLRRHCSDRLARFKVPRWIAYLPELARLPSGKVDRGATVVLGRPGLRLLR